MGAGVLFGGCGSGLVGCWGGRCLGGGCGSVALGFWVVVSGGTACCVYFGFGHALRSLIGFDGWKWTRVSMWLNVKVVLEMCAESCV